jgi:hypothetical protein
MMGSLSRLWGRLWFFAKPQAAESIWTVSVLGILVAPSLLHSSNPSDELIRNTIRLALVYYGFALLLLLRGKACLARRAWSLAWLAYLIHVALAFHFVHGWSHAHAFEHTRRASGVGEGLYVSHLFTLVWSLDVAWWWAAPLGHQQRPRWIWGALHGFMLFMVFNGAVVFATGGMRWAGVILFELLARQAVLTLGSRRAITEPRPASGIGPEYEE